jgi:hypothetical protein
VRWATPADISAPNALKKFLLSGGNTAQQQQMQSDE